MKNLACLLILAGVMLWGCSSSTGPDYNSYYDSLSTLDAKGAIALANDWHYSAPKIISHITQTEVIIEFPDNRTVKKVLPENLMYIGIAPYINKTHECETHYPSSCSGELSEKMMMVTARDESGTTIFDKEVKTLKNGFFELWLPRNKDISIKVSYDSKTGQETIPTRSDSRTCVTTIQLK